MKTKKSNVFVLDTYALLVFLNKERSFTLVKDILIRAQHGEITLLLSLVSWGELYYILIREVGEAKADEYMAKIDQLPIAIVPVDKTLVQDAARIKANGGLSYADCFVVATAMDRSATIVTGDKEFAKFERKVKIRWL